MNGRRNRGFNHHGETELEVHTDDIDPQLGKELDLEAAVLKWAQYAYQIQLNGKKDDDYSQLEEEIVDGTENHLGNVLFDINWAKIRYRTGKPNFNVNNQHGVYPDFKLRHMAIYNSVYANDSKDQQDFSFQVDKETESTVKIDLKCMLVTPIEMLSIEMPEELQQAGFGKYLKPVQANEIFTNKIKWQASNPVKVRPGKQIEATLRITEKEYKKDFSISMTIAGQVIVNVCDRNSNRFMTNMTGDIGVIWNAFGDKSTNVEVKGDKKIVFTTKGKCHLVYGVKQDVEIVPKKKSACCTIL